MRRIAITLTVLAFVAGAFGCSSDAPTPPKPGGGPGGGPTGTSALQIRLFTSNPNPPAGTCTLIQAIVTLLGAQLNVVLKERLHPRSLVEAPQT